MNAKKIVKMFFNEFELYLGAVISGGMFLVLLAQVISRYVFNSAFSWSEELALIFFIWSIYFGATAAIRRHQHLRLEIVTDKLKPLQKVIFGVFSNFCFALFNCVILGGIVPLVVRLYNNGIGTAVLDMPKWFNYAVLPTLFALMIIRLIQDSVVSIINYRHPNNADGEKAA